MGGGVGGGVALLSQTRRAAARMLAVFEEDLVSFTEDSPCLWAELVEAERPDLTSAGLEGEQIVNGGHGVLGC